MHTISSKERETIMCSKYWWDTLSWQPKRRVSMANCRKFLWLILNPQLATPLTMAVCAAHGVTSTSRTSTGTSFISLGSAITSLHPTANLPMRISTSRLGVQWWKMLPWSPTSSWSWKEQWLNWPAHPSWSMANSMFISSAMNWNCHDCPCSQKALWASIPFFHLISYCSHAAVGLMSFLRPQQK